MHIISGKYKGFKLKLVPSSKTRSTTHLIRKVVFDTLGVLGLTNKYVLDLFAGNGAYGFEALSRNAKKVCFVDNSLFAIKIINYHKQKFILMNSEVQIFLADYRKMLKIFMKKKMFFDLIIVDPPYKADVYYKLLSQLEIIMTDRGVVVCEMHKKKFVAVQINNLFMFKEKQYGNTKVTFYKKII